MTNLDRALEVTGLSPGQKCLLLVLAYRGNGKGFCWPGRARLMVETGLSRTGVKLAVAELEKRGLISRKPGFAQDRSVYTLNLGEGHCETLGGSVSDPGEGLSVTQGGSVSDPHNIKRTETEPKENQKRVPPSAGSSADAPLLPLPISESSPKRKQARLPVQFPSCLDTPDFKALWRRWCDHARAKGNAPTKVSQEAALARLAQEGPEKAPHLVATALQEGWRHLNLDRDQRRSNGVCGSPRPVWAQIRDLEQALIAHPCCSDCPDYKPDNVRNNPAGLAEVKAMRQKLNQLRKEQNANTAKQS